MKLVRIMAFASVAFCLFSCVSQKSVNYLQTIQDTSGKDKVVVPELVIQKDDQLSIQVYSASTRSDLSDAMYNLPSSGSSPGAQGGGPSVGGFLVDAHGNIEYPRIGTLHVEGLTKAGLAELIKKKINEKDSVLTNPSVIVRFTNMKITVLGEVNNQGVINFPGERITVLQAIGLAGGINEFGLKENVKIVREVNGERQIGMIDLSSTKAFQSPYYNLMQNDVVMVDPSNQKTKARTEDANFRRATFFLSVITTAAILYNIFR